MSELLQDQISVVGEQSQAGRKTPRQHQRITASSWLAPLTWGKEDTARHPGPSQALFQSADTPQPLPLPPPCWGLTLEWRWAGSSRSEEIKLMRYNQQGKDGVLWVWTLLRYWVYPLGRGARKTDTVPNGQPAGCRWQHINASSTLCLLSFHSREKYSSSRFHSVIWIQMFFFFLLVVSQKQSENYRRKQEPHFKILFQFWLSFSQNSEIKVRILNQAQNFKVWILKLL